VSAGVVLIDSVSVVDLERLTKSWVDFFDKFGIADFVRLRSGNEFL